MEINIWILERRKKRNIMLEMLNCSNSIFSSRHSVMEVEVTNKNWKKRCSSFCETVKAASDAWKSKKFHFSIFLSHLSGKVWVNKSNQPLIWQWGIIIEEICHWLDMEKKKNPSEQQTRDWHFPALIMTTCAKMFCTGGEENRRWYV